MRQTEEERARQAEAAKWAKLAEEERRKKEAAQRAEQESVAALKAQKGSSVQQAVPRGELPAEERCTGAILIKAAEYLVAANRTIADVIKNRSGRQKSDLSVMFDGLTYMPLFESEALSEGLSPVCSISSKKISAGVLQTFLTEIQADKSINADILHTLRSALQEVRCVKATFSDGNSIYLDGQLHTVWSTQHIPYDFSSCLNNLKSYINKYFYQNIPFVLFMAPGYDTPSKEFFTFLLSLEGKGNAISKLILYGNRFEELETIAFDQPKKRFYIFGCWPWQFSEHRKVNKIGQFKPVRFASLGKELYLAEVELVLTQPAMDQSLTLRGCAVKFSPTDKARQIILSNISSDIMSPEDMADTYFGHWPNMEEAFQDYSRKVELFTYTVGSQRFFSVQGSSLSKAASQDIKQLFAGYLEALDQYVRWHFLPTGYEDKPFAEIKQQFYDLPAELKREGDNTLITFRPPEGYALLKDLQYLTRRVNEREIVLNDGSRLWLFV
jgi:hypothetical protein